MRKPRLREVKPVAYGHTASKWHRLESNPLALGLHSKGRGGFLLTISLFSAVAPLHPPHPTHVQLGRI